MGPLPRFVKTVGETVRQLNRNPGLFSLVVFAEWQGLADKK